MKTRYYFLAFLALWAVVQWTQRRPDFIVEDFASRRQSDTQSIARHFAQDGIDILHPRIEWGGNGPGYVEAEFQLYPAILAAGMRVVGISEWVGQACSLGFMALTAIILFEALRRRFGDGPAFLAVALMLTSRGMVYLSTSIQPDTLALLLFVIAWLRFLRFVETERRQFLLEAALATAIAGLIKPPMLCLGISQALLVLLVRPRLLRRADLWVCWVCIVGAVALYLAQAHSLFVEYGNTFGTVSGGDRKTPKLQHLMMAGPLVNLAKFIVLWGVGIPGALAGIFLALRRQWTRDELAFATGLFVVNLVALRYTSTMAGPHYHIIEAVLGAWLVAHASRDLVERFRLLESRLVPILLAVAIVWQHAHFLRQVAWIRNDAAAVLARALQPMITPGDLIIFRSDFPRYDRFWESPYNFEDPRVFYFVHAHGWPLPADVLGHEPVARLALSGARFYIEGDRRAHPDPMKPSPDAPLYDDSDLHRWLALHADKKYDSAAGRIWEIRKP